MVEMMIFSTGPREIPALKETSRDLAARLTEESWEFYCFQTPEEAEDFLRENPSLDIICTDVAGREGIPLAKALRKKNPNAYMILIASPRISPASYMKPSIMAGSLLLRPLEKSMVREALREAFEEFFSDSRKPQEKGQLAVDNKEGRWLIDYEKIYYFEAREKKIFLNTGAKEIGFYDTMENLKEKLPDYFIRCHRSFLINGRMAEKLMLGKNLVVLKSGWEIPVSRSYKQEIKEFMG